ncbi:hypothetical protein RCC89_13980 [Cytophagaceae bacterium ABcell3]|nr:hypothetical protein RCC89_13980 [Cytophagaceae bacterium ABcell3]
MIETRKNNLYYLLAIVALATTLLLYWFTVKPLVVLAYEGTEPLWFKNILEFFYPRFYIEKHRFSAPFFLEKSNQIILRFSMIALLTIIAIWANTRTSFVRNFIKNQFTHKQVSTKNIKTIVVLFHLILLFFSAELTEYLLSAGNLGVFYKPIPLFNMLHLNWPPSWLIFLVGILQAIACLLSIPLKKWSFYSSVLAAILFIYLQGLSYGFEKIDHGLATLTYAAMLMPFLVKGCYKAKEKRQHLQNAFWLKLIMLSIAMPYFLSGLEKLFISHFSWATAATFRGYLQLHNVPAGQALAQSDFFSHTLPILALVFQLGFTLAVFIPKTRWVLLPIGIIFHMSTYVFFGVGAFYSPWWLMYLFFIPWDRLSFKKSVGAAS